MAKPRVMHVPPATQADAVRGDGLSAGPGGSGLFWVVGHRMAADGALCPPAVPPGTKATPSSRAGSAGPAVSITVYFPPPVPCWLLSPSQPPVLEPSPNPKIPGELSTLLVCLPNYICSNSPALSTLALCARPGDCAL
jgi:hypothetical protein